MCKLFIAAGQFKPAQVHNILSAANAAFASSQRDGFGFVAYGDNGTVAHGRYLDPAQFPGYMRRLPEFVRCNRIESGNLPKVTKAIVIHGRTSTNRVVIDNVHPFKRGGIYLAHNGVLRYTGSGKAPSSSNGCDTEEFFNWLLDRDSKSWVDAWSTTHHNWSGYGVFGVVNAKSGELTVAKCGSGNLSWAGNDEADLFSTSADDLQAIARKARLKVNRPIPVNPNTITVYRIRGRGAPVVDHCSEWSGFSTGVRDEAWSRSMGYGGGGLQRIGPGQYVTKRGSGYAASPVAATQQIQSNPFAGAEVPREKVIGPRYNERELFPDYDPTEDIVQES